jgi:release factor glutamine methyltransferase
MRIPSNKVQDIIRFAQKELEGIYSKEEIRQMTNMLITHFSGFSLTTIIAEPQKTVLESDLLKLNFAIKDLKHQKPLQYIIGETEFYNLNIKLNHKVLIPRPETEELVDIIIKENKNQTNIKIADLGCGSGAIALALKNSLKESKLWAYDIEDEAIEQTKENAKSLNLSIDIQKANILEENFTEEKFDIIVSNPPYVMDSEKELMKPNVLNHEPHSALFVPNNNPLLFYKSIAEFSKTHLNKNGKCYLEINEQLGKETLLLFPPNTTKLIKDIFGKDRFIIYNKPI